MPAWSRGDVPRSSYGSGLSARIAERKEWEGWGVKEIEVDTS